MFCLCINLTVIIDIATFITFVMPITIRITPTGFVRAVIKVSLHLAKSNVCNRCYI